MAAVDLGEQREERRVVGGEVGVGEDAAPVEADDARGVEPELGADRPIFVGGGRGIFPRPQTLLHRACVGAFDAIMELGVDHQRGAQDRVAELVHQDARAVVAIVGAGEQVLRPDRRERAAHAAGARVPIGAVGEAADPLGIMFALAPREARVVGPGLLPVALLGDVERRFVGRHDRDALPLADELGGEVGAGREHRHDDLAREQQRAVGGLRRGKDRDAAGVDEASVEGVCSPFGGRRGDRGALCGRGTEGKHGDRGRPAHERRHQILALLPACVRIASAATCGDATALLCDRIAGHQYTRFFGLM